MVPTTAQIPTNTKRCMPVYYSAGTATPTLQWFNKYVVTSVTDSDPIAQADVNLTSRSVCAGNYAGRSWIRLNLTRRCGLLGQPSEWATSARAIGPMSPLRCFLRARKTQK